MGARDQGAPLAVGWTGAASRHGSRRPWPLRRGWSRARHAAPDVV